MGSPPPTRYHLVGQLTRQVGEKNTFERILENIALAGCLDAPSFGEAGTLTVAVQGNPHESVAV